LAEPRHALEVPAQHLATVHASGLELVARSADGSVVARASLPADWDDPAVPDEVAPIYVSTRSDASDFTKVYGLEGHVGAAGATSLELKYDDIEQRGEGNIDHLVSGPTGVYLVETKHRRYQEHDLRKAKRQAAKLHDELRVRVTPAICIDLRRGRKPYAHHGVWIVSRDRIVDWLRAQNNPELDFARLAAFADTL